MKVMGYFLFLDAVEVRPSVILISVHLHIVHLHIENTTRSRIMLASLHGGTAAIRRAVQ